MLLIDANELLKEKVEIYIPPEDPEETWCFGENIEVIYVEDVKNAPAIEAEPVKHGRWKECGYKWRCSSCGVLMDIDGTPKENLLNYCPNCVAKMDLEASKESRGAA